MGIHTIGNIVKDQLAAAGVDVKGHHIKGTSLRLVKLPRYFQYNILIIPGRLL